MHFIKHGGGFVVGLLLSLGLGLWLFNQQQYLWLYIVTFFALSISLLQAWRFRTSLQGFANQQPKRHPLVFWGISLSVLSLLSAAGVYGYAQQLAQQYELPKEYHWEAPLWLLGIQRPFPELVTIPAGSFQMGSEDGADDEKSAHTVTIKNPFQMGKYEVTFREYDYYVWEMRQRGFDDIEFPKDEDWGRNQHPVIYVNWNDVQAYVQWLTQTHPQGLLCRLPSEAEWEYAARAGTTTKYYWGDEPDRAYANYGKEECCDGLAEGVDQWVNTAPVGSFKPNSWGLHDMSGNLWEWTQDRWHDDYQQAPIDGSAWEDGEGEARVLRGGSWDDTSYGVRSAIRYNLTYGSFNNGFRVLCSPR